MSYRPKETDRWPCRLSSLPVLDRITSSLCLPISTFSMSNGELSRVRVGSSASATVIETKYSGLLAVIVESHQEADQIRERSRSSFSK